MLPKHVANQAPSPDFDLEFMHQLMVLGVPVERAQDAAMEKLRRDIAKTRPADSSELIVD